MAAGAQLRGADNLVRSLDDAAGRLEDLSAAEHEAGQLLAQTGSRNAPRRTGHLAASHGYAVAGPVLTVTAATPYAAAVHARNPWLSKTLTATEDQVADIYFASVVDALDDVKGI